MIYFKKIKFDEIVKSIFQRRDRKDRREHIFKIQYITSARLCVLRGLCVKLLTFCEAIKITIGLLFTILLIGYSSCTENVNPPESMRVDYYIIVKDTSGFTESLTGDVFVNEAQVFANSISYQNFFEQQSDYAGYAVLKNILPDIYNFSVTKRLTEEEVLQVTGQSMERVLNGQVQNIQISESDTIEIYIYPATLGKLVFSEIYYNGSPPNPIPYYFHDQFTELYNNSNDTIYLDSLIIADVEYGFKEEDFIHAVHAKISNI